MSDFEITIDDDDSSMDFEITMLEADMTAIADENGILRIDGFKPGELYDLTFIGNGSVFIALSTPVEDLNG